MKFILAPLFIFFQAVHCSGQNEIGSLLKQVTFHENELYFFCRGTKSKAGMIANIYNFKDPDITHVGIGFLQGSDVVIYHVTDIIGQANALRIDSIGSFVKPADVRYFSIWSYPTTGEENRRIRKACKGYDNRHVVFDISFSINNDDSLYCSEFCIQVLQQANIESLKFDADVANLGNSIIGTILKRRTLKYYPADFFQRNKRVRKVFEYRFS